MKKTIIFKFMFLTLRVLEELLMAQFSDPNVNLRVYASLIDDVRRFRGEIPAS